MSEDTINTKNLSCEHRETLSIGDDYERCLHCGERLK